MDKNFLEAEKFLDAVKISLEINLLEGKKQLKALPSEEKLEEQMVGLLNLHKKPGNMARVMIFFGLIMPWAWNENEQPTNCKLLYREREIDGRHGRSFEIILHLDSSSDKVELTLKEGHFPGWPLIEFPNELLFESVPEGPNRPGPEEKFCVSILDIQNTIVKALESYSG